MRSRLRDGAQAAARLLEAGEDLQQRRLARAVRADEADVVALEDAERQLLEERRSAESLGDRLAGEEQLRHDCCLRCRANGRRAPRLRPARGDRCRSPRAVVAASAARPSPRPAALQRRPVTQPTRRTRGGGDGGGQQLLLGGTRQLLDAVLLLERRAPGPHPARPGEAHRQPGPRVARGAAALVLAQARAKVLRGARVERPVAADQDVDEGQEAGSSMRDVPPIVSRSLRVTIGGVNRGYTYVERSRSEAAG